MRTQCLDKVLKLALQTHDPRGRRFDVSLVVFQMCNNINGILYPGSFYHNIEHVRWCVSN